ncbi:MAG: restriction endonuclease subunit S [Euryarchaeota archaeon]|nr:restriction endonuclease subunit S [Euryarchaeota archaeon]
MSYPSTWNKIKFGDIAKRKSVRIDNPKESEYERYVGLEHLDSGELVIKRWGSTKDVSSSMQIFNENDILFARRNTYLKRISVVLFDGLCSGDIIVIEPILNHIIEGFLPIYMQFEEFENKVVAWSAGAFSKRIKWKQLADFEIWIPSKKEQQKIVDFIWSIHDNQERLENLIQMTEKLKRGLLEELLTKGIGNTKFKKTELGEIPEEWQIQTIKNISKSYAGGTPSRSKPAYFKGNIPWVKSTELNSGIIYDTEEKITNDGLENSSAKWIPENSVLVAMYGATVGQIALLKIKSTSNQAVMAIVPSEALNYQYLFYYLKSKKNDLISLTQGSGQPNLSKEIITSIKIPLPPLIEQFKLVSIIEIIEKNISQFSENYKNLIALKKKLTNEFLSGNLLIPKEAMN